MTNSNLENVQSKKNFRANNNYERSNIRGKSGGNREGGGFRIRLSENEMKAVRAIQETYNLKSTVAVLGFSVRTLSEMINDSELKDSVYKYAQKNNNSSNRFDTSNKSDLTKNKAPDPFARPVKSQSVDVNNNKAIDIDDK
tara:strand:- start:84 stop:506 length:423 start_codon:yes stop_codon:yes gene_type:complete